MKVRLEIEKLLRHAKQVSNSSSPSQALNHDTLVNSKVKPKKITGDRAVEKEPIGITSQSRADSSLINAPDRTKIETPGIGQAFNPDNLTADFSVGEVSPSIDSSSEDSSNSTNVSPKSRSTVDLPVKG